jgi:hypothetical protein
MVTHRFNERIREGLGRIEMSRPNGEVPRGESGTKDGSAGGHDGERLAAAR